MSAERVPSGLEGNEPSEQSPEVRFRVQNMVNTVISLQFDPIGTIERGEHLGIQARIQREMLG